MYIPEAVRDVINTLEKNGFEAFAVGGCVRDSLMGRTPGDYDVTTSAVPEEMLRVFAGWRVVETGLQHGTVTVVHKGMNIEVTAYRVDGEYLDNRHPAGVTFTRSLEEDLARRDFTVNAMAYSEIRGLVDLYSGQEDMAAKVIRCVGSAEKRFSEDGLRILRALRFSAVLGFTPDREDTGSAVHRMAHLLRGISRERIHVELRKLLGGKCAGRILEEYGDVITAALPELTEEAVQEAGRRMHLPENAAYPGCGDTSMRFALLFAKTPADKVKSAVRSLKMSREEEREIFSLLENLPVFAKDNSRYTLRRLAGENGYDHLYRLSALHASTDPHAAEKWQDRSDAISALSEEDPPNTLKSLAVTGTDLIPLGITGKKIGEVLKDTLDQVLRDNLPNDRETLMTYIGETHK